MGIAIYDNIYECLDSRETVKEQMEIINDAIKALRLAIRDFASKSHIEEYQFNDGQTIIRTKYRSIKEITDAIFVLKRDYQDLLQSPNGIGRQWVNRDQDSFC